MDFDILYAIQSIRTPLLDEIMVKVFNDFVGSKGQIWVWLGMIMFIIPKTRKAGAGVLISYLLAYFIGDGYLKDIFARVRPCNVVESIDMIVSKPSSYSFPSVHSLIAFASAMAIYMNYKKIGIVALVFAALIAFARLYYFVHFPSDVLVGSLLGIVIGFIVAKLLKGKH